jgi:hypothetical protein
MGREFLEHGERVDRPGVAGERNELEERFIQARRRDARREGGAQLPTQRPVLSERRRDRNPGQA